MLSLLEIEKVVLPAGISLIHELGHAIQYIENPQGFKEMFDLATSGSDLKTRFEVKSRKDEDGKQKVLKRQFVRVSRVAQMTLENDNVTRHEAPVCRELGLPHRVEYD